MKLTDLLRLAAANLMRNRARSVMTLVGVLIGVAALMTLLSYGAGLQRNARGEFEALELYNTLRVTSTPNPFESLGDVAYRTDDTADADTLAPIALTDSLVAVLDAVPGVLAAYPEVTFPVQMKANGRKVVATMEAVPMVFGTLDAYQPEAGSFFETSADSAVMIAPAMAERLGFSPATTAVGRRVTLVTASLDMRALRLALKALRVGLSTLPVRMTSYEVQVAGLLSEADQPVAGFLRAVAPLDFAAGLQKLTFFGTIDLLVNRSTAEGYRAVRVQLEDRDAEASVRAAVEGEGLYVTSFREQFERMERLFIIMDLALGIIGFIALLVATIGIANTMMMNVMERYREIGVMKAIGGEERHLQGLFLVESSLLGAVGGLLGLALGWLVMAGIQAVVAVYLGRIGIPRIDIFHTPLSMMLAIVGVALFVSIAAGWLPARRAARVEPLKALRNV